MSLHVDPLVLALDAGGGGCRASIYDRRGDRVAHAHCPWRAFVPPDLAPFGREYDVGALRDAVQSSIRAAASSIDATRIAALCCTGQRIACAFVDELGETIYAGPNGDVRALAAGDLRGLDDDVLYARTGRFPAWIFAPGRLRWFEAARPSEFQRIRHVLGLSNWIGFELTGVAATDATLAADLMMFDVATRS
ncbi:MAG TPA: hypothetical protein ENK57_12860, partial [Polyangiaceae bacterium]|nr:hypothetical protein [Polyangiaceae bacterium]